MTLIKLVLRLLCVCCFVLAILIVIIPTCIAPDSNSDNNRKTRYWSMSAMRSVFQYALNQTGSSNMLEYIESTGCTQNIPHIMSSEMVRKIIKDSGVAIERLKFDNGRSFYEGGVFLDAWGRPIIVTLTTNRSQEFGITMHSFGKNRKNENGDGDDILLWNDVCMSFPPSIVKNVIDNVVTNKTRDIGTAHP